MTRIVIRRLPLALCAVGLICCAAGPRSAATDSSGADVSALTAASYGKPIKTGVLQLPALNEVSGMAASRRNRDVLWVHNDSGDKARVFAVTATGRHLATYSLTGATAIDWEDMAIGPGPVSGKHYLYLGDIGDNEAKRQYVTVYRVEEPALCAEAGPVERSLEHVRAIKLRYEDGPRDAETLMVDPVTTDLYVVSKRELRSRLYRASAVDLATDGTVTMRMVAQLPWGWATAGEISPYGGQMIIRGYAAATVWHMRKGTDPASAIQTAPVSITLAAEPQGEAICFSADERGFYTVSEGDSQPIYYYPLLAAPERVETRGS